MIRWTLSLLFVAFLLVGNTAWACPSCFSEAERRAYIGTTLFLSALPLMLLGFLALRIYRGSRQPSKRPEKDVYG